MLAAWIYCPRSCRWARIIVKDGWYIACCSGYTRRCRDEYEAFGWAEWMLSRQQKAG